MKLRLRQTLSSALAEAGDRVDFNVMEDVYVNGVVVIAKGALAAGTVTKVHTKRRMARGGKLELELNVVRLVDGETVVITATAGGKGKSRIGVMAGAMAATALLSPAGSTLFLLMKGHDIIIPRGTEITAYIDGAVPLDMAKLTSAQSSSAQAAPVHSPLLATPATASTDLTFTSLPEGADVDVDDGYVGSTPTVVRVKAGDHTVRISKKGYQDFEKKLHADGSSISITAELTRKRESAESPIPIGPVLR